MLKTNKNEPYRLKYNIQFFADDNGGNDDNDGKNDDNFGDKEKNKDDKGKKKDIMIPKNRFDDVNQKYKDVKDELDKLKKEQKAKEDADKKEQGKFEDLYNTTKTDLETTNTTLKTSKERVEALEGVINNLLESKLKDIPKDFHDLIPENLTPEQKLNWLNQAESKGLFKDNTEDQIGKNTNPDSKQKIDVKDLNPIQLISNAYATKK